MRYRFASSMGLLIAVCFALWPSHVLAAPAFSANVSGVEVFPGIRQGNVVSGATFVGWVNAPSSGGGWEACPGNCAAWRIVVNYQGTPGIGSSVTMLSGSWSINVPNSVSTSGMVTGGEVVWPASLTTSIGCGPGVATISVALVSNTGSPGSVQGCLDDAHMPQVFPPKIWSTFFEG